jgi:hypothetical protein
MRSAEGSIGDPATRADGACGELTRVVADPVAGTVTHLAVEPEHRQGLVPLALAEVTADGVRFGCTLAEFARLDLAEDTHVVPRSSGSAAYDPGQVLARPNHAPRRTWPSPAFLLE